MNSWNWWYMWGKYSSPMEHTGLHIYYSSILISIKDWCKAATIHPTRSHLKAPAVLPISAMVSWLLFSCHPGPYPEPRIQLAILPWEWPLQTNMVTTKLGKPCKQHPQHNKTDIFWHSSYCNKGIGISLKKKIGGLAILHQAPWQENSQATAGMDVYVSSKKIERKSIWNIVFHVKI